MSIAFFYFLLLFFRDPFDVWLCAPAGARHSFWVGIQAFSGDSGKSLQQDMVISFEDLYHGNTQMTLFVSQAELYTAGMVAYPQMTWYRKTS